MRIRSFTLLEMMIVIALLAIAGSIMGIRIYRLVEEKQFSAATDRLGCELESCRRLALNMQADWMVRLEKQPNRIYLTRVCPETNQSTTVSWDAAGQLMWDDHPIQQISIQFSATGKVIPSGLLEMATPQKRVQWQLPYTFRVMEGTDGFLPRPE